MDYFVKTRRNWRSPESKRKGKPGCHIGSVDSSGDSVMKTFKSDCCEVRPRHATVSTWSESSSGYESGTNSDDRRKFCSASPLRGLSDPSSGSESGSCDESLCTSSASDSELSFRWLHEKTLRRSDPALFSLGSDLMAQVLSFLDPCEILRLLTTPLCQEWHRSYGSHQDLWKTLCLLEPFKANVGDGADDSSCCSSDSYCSVQPEAKEIFGEYRLMYTSFVRCIRYLDRIQDDAKNGKASLAADYGNSGFPHFGMSKGLKRFLAKKHGLLDKTVEATHKDMNTMAVGVTDDGYRKRHPSPIEDRPSKKPKFGNSMITSKLLGPSSAGKPSHLQLPKSCAIYSIVNWMVAFPEVEGIQIKCVGTLPVLLEDESQRKMAQRVGIVEVVLRSMLRFPSCPKLHVAAFHAMVLLARPLGGREGMLFDNSIAQPPARNCLDMLESPWSPSQNNVASLDQSAERKLNGINGIAVMLDSMRRFQGEPDLQAMSCWALVNLALVPAQKTMLLSLGGIQAAINAMRCHPNNYDVQFRALFALINLVVSSKTQKDLIFREGLGGENTEKDVLDNAVQDVSDLVVVAMKNFCSNGTILNRACLVLHNIAQSQDYLTTLLWTPHCYQMLEWCIVNYPTDPVLRRSATSTLHRLQVLLSQNERLRMRFAESIRSEKYVLALGRQGKSV